MGFTSGFYSGKRILVTGGTGLIGIPLVRMLSQSGARVRVASLDKGFHFDNDIEFLYGDLCSEAFCAQAVEGMDIVFHVAGIKGSIGVGQSKSATFLIKNILMNMFVMEAARKANVEEFLYVSSICVYPPAEIFREEDFLTGLPHPSDQFGGIAKMVGELQLRAYELQYSLKNYSIVRPVNTYGPHDNFNPIASLVIPALIYRIYEGERPLRIWGDGSAIRDFVYVDDVAEMLCRVIASGVHGSFNVGSGQQMSIMTVAETICNLVSEIEGAPVPIEWDTSKPSGEHIRVASMEHTRSVLNWLPPTSLESGLRQTILWYRENRSLLRERYDILAGK